MSEAIKQFVTGKATMKANMKTYHYYENVGAEGMSGWGIAHGPIFRQLGVSGFTRCGAWLRFRGGAAANL